MCIIEAGKWCAPRIAAAFIKSTGAARTAISDERVRVVFVSFSKKNICGDCAEPEPGTVFVSFSKKNICEVCALNVVCQRDE